MSPTFMLACSQMTGEEWGDNFLPRLRSGLSRLGRVVEVQLPSREPVILSHACSLTDIDGLFLHGARLTRSCLGDANRLQIVGVCADNRGIGLDLEALFERNIAIVDNTCGWAQSVAEIGLNLILNCLRQTAWYHLQTALGQEDWMIRQFSDNPAFVNGELMHKRVGIVGLGHIGGNLARLLQAFPTATYAYDPFVPQETFSAFETQPMALDELLIRAQIIAVCVPPNPSSQGLLDARRVALIAPGSIVILITRAGIVDMAALRQRVLAGEIFLGADVFDVEPLPPDDPLRGLPNVVHYPHIAGRTQDVRDRMTQLIVDDFQRFFNGKPLRSGLTQRTLRINLTGCAETPADSAAPLSSHHTQT